MRKSILTVAFLFFALLLKAADYKISGRVLDSLSKQPLTNASVVIIDSTGFVLNNKLTKTNGEFLFGKLEKKYYEIKISHIGYKTQTKVILASEFEKEINTFFMVLESIVLTEIKVTAKKPLITTNRGIITFNIEDGIWENLGTMSEILKQIPMISQSPLQLYSYRGKEISIYIDNRKINVFGEALENRLLSIQSNEIESIDLISNPGAKFESTDKVIILIKTKKLKAFGTSLSFNSGLAISKNYKSNNGISLTNKNKFFTILTGVNLYKSKLLLLNSNSRHISFKENEAKFEDNSNDLQDLLIKSAKLGIDFNIGKTININALSTVSFDKSTRQVDYYSNYVVNNSKYYLNFDQSDLYKFDQISHSVNINKKFKNSSLGIEIDKNNFKYNYVENAFGKSEEVNGQSNNLEINNPAKRGININSLKASYTTPIKNGSIIFGGHLKESNITTKASYFQNDSLYNNGRSSFTYSENVKALYISLDKEINTFFFQLGLRYEAANLSGVEEINFTQKKYYYPGLYPSIYIQHTTKGKTEINFNYNKKVTRPNFDDFSSRLIFKSPYFFKKGGDVILPATSNSIEIGIKKGNITFGATHYFQNNRFVQVPITENGQFTFYQYSNLSKFRYLALNSSYSKSLKPFWYASINLEGWRSYVNSKEYNIQKKGNTFSIAIQNTFNLNKLTTLAISWSYTSKEYANVFNFTKQEYLNLNLSKSAFNKKLVYSIGVSDLFNTLKLGFESKKPELILFDNYKNETRFIKYNLIYKIGKKSIIINKNKSGVEAEKNRASV